VIAALQKLRMIGWSNWGTVVRHRWRSFVQKLKTFQYRCLATNSGRALTISLLLHATFASWAALSFYQVRKDSTLDHQVIAAFDMASTQTEFPLPIMTLAQEPETVTNGGSSGSPISALAPDPTLIDPLAMDNAVTTNAIDLNSVIAANLGSAVSNASDRIGNGKGRGKGEGIGNGIGSGIGNGKGNGKQFFGMPIEGKSLAYVLDCSLSMNHPHDSDAKTRFGRIKQELINAISHLKPDQEFFIVFFNHEAIPMPANGMVAANSENQSKYLYWMQQVTAVGDTDPTAALEIALRLRPDVIYFLTDGAFSTEANEIVRSIKQSRSIIHTFTFEQNLTKKQQAGIELMRQKKHSTAMLKLGENTYRQTREIFIADQVMHDIAAHNGGKFHVIP